MNPARTLLLAAAGNDTLNTIATRSPVVRRATRAFMPGETMEEALGAAQALAVDGRRILFTHLGEALTETSEAVGVRDHYLELFRRIRALGIPGEVSVKPTQLAMDSSPEACLEYTMELAAAAEATGSVLWVDMEDHTYVDRTLELYEAVKRVHPSTGLALQAYLYRTEDDLARLEPLRPVIRLVKGAYAEPASVAYPRKADTDAAYARLAEAMLGMVARHRDGAGGRAGAAAAGEDDAVRTGPRMVFGTHDLGLLRSIDRSAQALGLGRDAWETHMLYGIAAGQQTELRRAGFAVATLISYGSAWYRWYMRRLAERPANVWFVVRSAFR
jgi:proline dehydrogenase